RGPRASPAPAGSGHRAFDVELLHLFADARRKAAMPTIGLAIVVGVMSSIWIKPADLLVWIALIFAALLVGYKLAGRFLAATNGQINVVDWRGRILKA